MNPNTRTLHPPPKLPSTKTYTLKPRCITLTQPPNNLHLSNNPSQATLHFQNMTTLENHNTNSPSLHSPKETKLGKKWKEYQGLRNWDGLLDPLDDNLRAEILRYGHFVEAAYKSFDFDPSSSQYANCMFPNTTLLKCCGLPNTGYKVTKQLHATSGIQLPSWVGKAPSWVATQSSYIGYVAVCDNMEEIKRLGRRDIVVAFRGTCTCLEWLENFRATLTNFSNSCNHKKGVDKSGAMVESGFLSLFSSSSPESTNSSFTSLQKKVMKEVSRILQTYKHESLSVTVTGHSLGAALAILTAFDVKTAFPRLSVTVMSFGGPRVGNKSFQRQLEKQGTKVLRIVNSDDVITKLPGFVFDDEDMESRGGVHVVGFPSWIQKRVEEARWMYAEVGKELRLCSNKDSPYLGSMNVATCHELHTYLHLVDGFVSSTCPFRASAKRFLRR